MFMSHLIKLTCGICIHLGDLAAIVGLYYSPPDLFWRKPECSMSERPQQPKQHVVHRLMLIFTLKNSDT